MSSPYLDHFDESMLEKNLGDTNLSEPVHGEMGDEIPNPNRPVALQPRKDNPAPRLRNMSHP